MEIDRVYYKHYRNIMSPTYDKNFQVTGYKPALLRYYRSGDYKSKWQPSCLGGATECVARVKFGENVYEISTRSRCRNDEHFVYKLGRQEAYRKLQRLLGHIKALENVVMEINESV